jgi:HAD superfamily hydrolase (TIGR01509 family)
MAIRGMLLDVDGTLVLSNDAQAQAWVEAFTAHGRDVPLEKVCPLIGMGGDKVVPELAPGLNDKDGDGKEIADARKKLMLEKFGPTLQPAPGARAFVQRARQEGLTIVVASSASAQELEMLLTVARVDDLLRERTTMDDAGESKPAPDIVAVALKKSGLGADEVVMIGDSPYDIASAAQIGVGTIALRCGGFSDDDLTGALALYDDPADLLAHYDTSPLREASRPAGAEVRGEPTPDLEEGGV